MAPFSARDLCREAERELGQRRRVYPRLIEQRKMTQAASDRQMALMQQIRDEYDEKATAEERRGELPL
jgi:hypothetical protein